MVCLFLTASLEPPALLRIICLHFVLYAPSLLCCSDSLIHSHNRPVEVIVKMVNMVELRADLLTGSVVAGITLHANV